MESSLDRTSGRLWGICYLHSPATSRSVVESTIQSPHPYRPSRSGIIESPKCITMSCTAAHMCTLYTIFCNAIVVPIVTPHHQKPTLATLPAITAAASHSLATLSHLGPWRRRGHSAPGVCRGPGGVPAAIASALSTHWGVAQHQHRCDVLYPTSRLPFFPSMPTLASRCLVVCPVSSQTHISRPHSDVTYHTHYIPNLIASAHYSVAYLHFASLFRTPARALPDHLLACSGSHPPPSRSSLPAHPPIPFHP